MTEPRSNVQGRAVALAGCPPDGLIRLELWGDQAAVARRALGEWGMSLPAVGHAATVAEWRVLWIEPGVFMIRTPLADLARALTQLTAIAGEDGAVIDITGGLTRFSLTGPGWRELLTIGAVFDVEDPAFGPGRTAATVLQHAAIWIDVITDEVSHVYALPSYAQELAEGWLRAIRRMGV